MLQVLIIILAHGLNHHFGAKIKFFGAARNTDKQGVTFCCLGVHSTCSRARVGSNNKCLFVVVREIAPRRVVIGVNQGAAPNLER